MELIPLMERPHLIIRHEQVMLIHCLLLSPLTFCSFGLGVLDFLLYAYPDETSLVCWLLRAFVFQY